MTETSDLSQGQVSEHVIGPPRIRHTARLAHILSHRSVILSVVLSALVVGAGLRLYFYFDRRSLDGDESNLSENIVTRTYGELRKPLDANQGAPLAFLLA